MIYLAILVFLSYIALTINVITDLFNNRDISLWTWIKMAIMFVLFIVWKILVHQFKVGG